MLLYWIIILIYCNGSLLNLLRSFVQLNFNIHIFFYLYRFAFLCANCYMVVYVLRGSLMKSETQRLICLHGNTFNKMRIDTSKKKSHFSFNSNAFSRSSCVFILSHFCNAIACSFSANSWWFGLHFIVHGDGEWCIDIPMQYIYTIYIYIYVHKTIKAYI